jgi:hypothetical protein
MGGYMNPLRLTNVCMVEPLAFGFNAETAGTNRFQNAARGSADSIAMAARTEFAALVTALRSAGIGVAVAQDSAEPVKPDAVFPNNWVSFHVDGSVVLYPMHSVARRAERREAVIDAAKSQLGFVEQRRIDLTTEERQGRFLEGTGSLVLDHDARVAYACRSPRTDESLVKEWARLMNYEPLVFDAATPDGTPVYHTNVVLWIGARVAGIGLDWIPASQRDALQARLGAGSRQVLPLRGEQLQSFAGNMLELADAAGRRHLVMSATAAGSLDAAQRQQLQHAGVVPLSSAIPTIEKVGGGSVRCMLAEVPVMERTR